MATIVYCSRGNHHYDGWLGNRIIFKNLEMNFLISVSNMKSIGLQMKLECNFNGRHVYVEE